MAPALRVDLKCLRTQSLISLQEKFDYSAVILTLFFVSIDDLCGIGILCSQFAGLLTEFVWQLSHNFLLEEHTIEVFGFDALDLLVDDLEDLVAHDEVIFLPDIDQKNDDFPGDIR